jgi:hypothetical protein
VQLFDQAQQDIINYSVALMKLPHFIWVMEAAPLSSYLNGECTSELVIDPTANPNEDAVLYMRMGDLLTYDGRVHRASNNPKRFVQYTHNLGEV